MGVLWASQDDKANVISSALQHSQLLCVKLAQRCSSAAWSPEAKLTPGTARPRLTLSPRKGPSRTSLGLEMTHFALSCLCLLRSPRCHPERQLQRRSKDENASNCSAFLSSRTAYEQGRGAYCLASCVLKEAGSAVLDKPTQDRKQTLAQMDS